jgi:hypothetical protein
MEKSLITCNFYGQLGNQLFIIAAALSYSWDYHAEPIFPGLNTFRNRTSYNKEHLFFRLNASLNPRPFLNIYKTCLETEWFSSKRIPFHRDLIIDGYFQSWIHFHHHKEKIFQIFAPSEMTVTYLKKKYEPLFKNPKIVAVHVRTQSKETHISGHHPFWGLDYYQNAMNIFPSDSIFLIISDRINWCKHHFPKLGKNCVFIDGNSGIEDLFLLTRFKNQILCNSSFSWWAAYLNEHFNNQSIFPKNWKDPTLVPNPPDEYFFLPSWVRLDCPIKNPYPEDMWFYDKESQSVDNNN